MCRTTRIRCALFLILAALPAVIGLQGVAAAESPQLLVSTRSDRAAPASLAGAELAGDVFVFVEATSTVRVRFWLDDPDRSGAVLKDERNGPWDLAGTAKNNTALPFDTTQLVDGPHNVTAEIAHVDGSAQTVHAEFTVVNNAPVLTFTPGSLDLTAEVDGPVLERPVQVTSSPAASVALVSDQPWLTVSPGGGGTPLDGVVRVDPDGLAEGGYTGRVTASADGFADVTLTVTLVVGTATASPIQVSASKTRSPASLLAGGTVQGNAYIFVADDPGVDSVRFWVDDPDGSGTPFRTEKSAPYDLAGGTVSTASPFDTTQLVDGPHSVTARLVNADGTHVDLNADFTVANNAPSLVFTPTRVSATVPEDRPTVSFDTALSATSGTPSAQLSSSESWLTLDQCCTAGVPATISVTADPAALPDGRHEGVITATAPSHASATFTVELIVAGDAPTQVHLAWVGDPTTSMSIVWRTGEAVTSELEVRRAGDSVWSRAPGAPRTFTGSGVLHEVALTGLHPDTAYEYRVPGDGTASSPVHSFTTASVDATDFDIVYLADTGIAGRLDGLTTGTADVVEAVAGLDPLAVLPGGDYAYFDSDKRFATQDDAMDAWFEQVEPFAANAPMMPTYGNHEALLKETYEPWAARFPTPAGHDNRRNYAFDVGPVHFISIFAVYGQAPLTSTQMKWLKADLAQAAAGGRPWIVPYMHVSAFADGASHPSNLDLREQLGPVFEQYGVDLVLMSHDQSYERTYPLVDVPATNTPTTTRTDCVSKADGVTWVKVSPAGKLSNQNGGFSPWTTDLPPHWTAVRSNSQHHFARVHVAAGGDLRLDVYGLMGGGSPKFLVDTVRFAAGTC